jgi:hypothetical protein
VLNFCIRVVVAGKSTMLENGWQCENDTAGDVLVAGDSGYNMVPVKRTQ